MSLKSFDDFCAKMVNNEPLSQKEILDERQKAVRSRITFIAVLIFGCLSVVNTVIMDAGLKWCEMFSAPMMWFFIASYIYWLIANALSGSLFGVEGTLYAKKNGWLMIFISGIDGLTIAFDNKGITIAKNGMLTVKFMLVVFLVLSLLSGIITLLLAHRYNKPKDEDE